MIYRIKMDNIDIYGTSEDMALLSPMLDMELNSAGSLEFVLPESHKYYDLPQILKSDVEAYENNELIWYGRVLETSMEMNKNKTIYCEGALAYFNDSIQRPTVFESTTVHEFFNYIIDAHNSQMQTSNRMFTVGNVTVDNIEIYRELNYETTKDVIEKMCIGAEGGYLFFRKENGVNYIDWLSELPYESTQPIKFGLNLVDLSQKVSGANLCTAVIPLGKEIDGVKLTVSDINGGLDYIDSEAVDTFGRITKVVEFSDIALDAELLSAGQKWLASQEIVPFTIECDAAEMHHLDNTYSLFRVGQTVHVKSTPHLVDNDLPLTKITIDMASAIKKTSVGTQEKTELTEIYKT